MRKSCRRRERPLVNPLTYAIEGSRPPTGERLAKVDLMYRSSLDSLSKGTGTIDDLKTLSQALAFIEILNSGCVRNLQVKVSVDFDVEPVKVALRAIHARRLRTGRYGLASSELAQLRDLVQVHADVAQCVLVRDWERVNDYMRAREAQGLVERLRVPAN